jgi:5-methylcytosine-specific restriction endonuclease McrA
MRKARSIDDVRAEVRRITGRKPRRNERDLSRWEGEIDDLLDGVREFLPVWTVLPSVFRVGRIQTSGTTAEFAENIALPAARHTMELTVTMLNFIREGRGLEAVTMPLFLQPDDIEYALTHPADCHCDEEREVAARARTWKRLGGRASKRWLHTGQEALDRDGRTCTSCGATRDLHLHATGEGLEWADPAGYVTLCRRCHVVQSGDLSPAARALRNHLESDRIEGSAIRSQLALVLQKSSVRWVALAVGPEYAARSV